MINGDGKVIILSGEHDTETEKKCWSDGTIG